MPRRLQISVCKSLLKHQALEASQRLKPLSSLSSRRPIPAQPGPDSVSPFAKLPKEGYVHGGAGCFGSRSSALWNRRELSTQPGNDAAAVDQDKVVDLINIKFAEAREEIEMAMESKETVYFDEEAECARAAVKEVLDLFEGLLAKLPESERAALQRSMGLKIEQLKAELQQLDD